jgi:hypothetical protein
MPPTDVETSLRAWESFYVIVGSSAGALTGLQFVVLTLAAEAGTSRRSRETTSAFGSPTIVHFCAALFVAAVLSVPWSNTARASVAISACGAAGILYVIVVLRRTFRQESYRPVLEDWIWHLVLPFASYGAIFAAGQLVRSHVENALLLVGGAALLLIFIGIHNAWDSVTYITHEMLPRRRERSNAAVEPEPGAPARPAASGASPSATTTSHRGEGPRSA